MAKQLISEQRLTVREVASALGRSPTTILAYIRDGRISPVLRHGKRGPGAIEVPASSVEQYLESRLVAAATNQLSEGPDTP